MKIVIIGDGKVGFKLAKLLSEDENDVTIVDSKDEKLKRTGNVLDVRCIAGDGTSFDTQEEAGVNDADLVVACTSFDEVNMICCLVAKKLGAKSTIARIRNPLYYDQMSKLKKDLKLSMYVNPEKETARAMSRLIAYPNANHVEEFAHGKVEIIEYSVYKDSPFVGMTIKHMSSKYGNDQLVVAVESENEEVFIPDGNYEIKENDILHFVFDRTSIDKFFKQAGSKVQPLKKIMICGGGRIAFYLARELCESGKKVKIIEQDVQICQQLASELPKANIVNGNVSKHSLLIEEGISDADVFIGLTGIDEQNMILGLFAKGAGVKKVIVKVNDEERVKILKKFGIESVLSPKALTANVIMSYVKARQRSLSSDTIEAVYDLIDGKVRALEFFIHDDSKYTNKPLKSLSLKKGCLITCIIRDGKPIIPDGESILQKGDEVIIVTNMKKTDKLENIFE